MNQHENFSTGTEARQSMPSRPWSPSEGARQDMLVRYLGAVAVAAAEHTEPEKQPPTAPADASPGPANGSGTPLVRDVMDVPAAWLRDDLPYREIARLLAHEHVGALPVVDAEGRVVGVVSESDLLAKVAVEASGHRRRPVGRLRERRLHDKARGETAADLMTSPAITVLPGATVAEAAWLAALSRLKRIPVTDHEGQLVGTVGRDTLLQTLIRDDAGIRAEVEDRIRTVCALGDRTTVEVTVRDGIVELSGQVPAATGDRLVAETEAIADVVEVKNLLTAG
ncbi:CBS domain-containing protein [Streptomyces sasae]|uniref:CBS domain-containing protein n=1 Tax=Streptomyces sasae TaxID=1266772 RepID=UPI00293195E3|nr:CBS domain-containing protein [Streptomyces sasae]